jgi:DNA mismatch repair protein MutL
MEGQGNKIRVLDKATINKIAAGEVIERPASIVKELADNSIDAGATEIRIEVESGGKRSILVRDNGYGMGRADTLLSFRKHATSKLTKIEDLNTISTMGFRGEALASITAVAKVEILTRQRRALAGTRVLIHGGKVLETSEVGVAPGTTVHVKDLFFNIPARCKYLKSDRIELAHITDIVTKLALANPNVSFTLLSEGKNVLWNSGSGDLFNSIVNLLGPETARSMLPLEFLGEDFELKGYISKPELTRGASDQLFLFVNTRPVVSKAAIAAIREGYYTKIPKGRYPVAVLSLTLNPQEVDVNVHPRKAEVRFSQEKELKALITQAVENALSEHGLAPEVRIKENRYVQKIFKSPASVGVLEEARTPESKSKFLREKPGEDPESYTYSIKDTDRRLKRSERFFELENKSQNPETQKQNPETQKQNPETQKQSPEKKANAELLEGLRVIGQVSKVYILAEKGEDLVVIDQHAAHERILYEQISKLKKSMVQELITPVTVDLTLKEKVLMEEYIPYLEEYGFGISEFGDNTYVVTFVPEVFGRLEAPEIIHDIISDLLAAGQIKKDTGVSERVCKTMACRAAIKGGAACNIRQMEELIEQLKLAETPCSCPHGRPTFLSFTKRELDRMFSRVQ